MQALWKTDLTCEEGTTEAYKPSHFPISAVQCLIFPQNIFLSQN